MEIYLLNLYLLIFITGTVFGSFLNVVIYRLPIGKSVISPRSHCPRCEKFLKWWQLIPVISFLMERGRCANCGTAISPRYLLVEVVLGFLFLIFFLRHGFSWLTVVYWIVFSCLVAIAFIDWNHYLIPNKLTGIILLFGVGASLAGLTIPIYQGVIGALVGGAILLALAILSQGGMGGGDVKLSFALGFFTGWQLMLLLLFLASVLGAVFGVGKMVILGRKKGRMIPFGPFLSLAAFMVINWGDEIIIFYFSFFNI